MDSLKLAITGLIIISVSVSATDYADYRRNVHVSAWIGDDLHFKCGNQSSDSAGQFWTEQINIGSERWSRQYNYTPVVNNDRFTLVNNGTILRIVNVTVNDTGFYICNVFTQPTYKDGYMLIVEEKTCGEPEKLANGMYWILNPRSEYRRGDRIEYGCDRGHRLIGEAIRTCTGTPKGWIPLDHPYCEPEHIGRLLRRVDRIENQFNIIHRMITRVANNTSDLWNKMSEFDRTSLGVDISLLESLSMKTDGNRPRTIACTNDTKVIDPDAESNCCTMQLGVRNGQNVSEFQWTVDVNHSKTHDDDGDTYNSRLFCPTVPGYRFRLTSFMSKNDKIFARVRFLYIPSENDEHLIWPFSTRYDLTVLLSNGTEFLYKHFSGEHPTCASSRPTHETSLDCSTENPEWKNVRENKQHVLKDGSVVVKVYLYN